MSAKLLGMVWELDIPAHERDVLMALCDHAKPDGTDCYPSVARVAWMLGKDPRTVQRTIRSLEAKGALVTEDEKVGGKGNTVNYTIRIDVLPRKPPFRPSDNGDVGAGDSSIPNGDAGAGVPESQRVTPVAAKGDAGVPQRVTPTPPELTTEPTATHPELPDTAAARPSLALTSESDGSGSTWNGGVIFDAWLKRHPEVAARLSKRERGKYGAACARLAEEHCREEVAAAFLGMGMIAPYSMGETWDPMDLERKFAKAMTAAADHPRIRERREAAALEDALVRRQAASAGGLRA